jgi:hypothetical protein
VVGTSLKLNVSYRVRRSFPGFISLGRHLAAKVASIFDSIAKAETFDTGSIPVGATLNIEFDFYR